MENIFVLIFSLFRECINIVLIFSLFDGIAEHEGRKTELANAILFYEIAYFFYLFFCLTI